MSLASLRTQVTFDGQVYTKSRTLETDGVLKKDPTLPAAKTGTLTTRTDNDTGTVTGQVSHGISTGDKIDIFWAAGSRRHVTVGTVSGNSIPIDLGTGDNLPSASTALTLMKPQVENFPVSGDALTVIVASCKVHAAVSFLDASDAVLFSQDLAAGQVYTWDSLDGSTNPLAGAAVAKVALSHADNALAQQVMAGVLFD